MTLNRRLFLGAIAGAFVPEGPIWRPGRIVYSFPRVIAPPCPFRIYARSPEDEDTTAVMNAIFRSEWSSNVAFRRAVERRTAPAVALDLLHDLQAGRGFFRHVYDDWVYETKRG